MYSAIGTIGVKCTSSVVHESKSRAVSIGQDDQSPHPTPYPLTTIGQAPFL